MSTFIWQTSTTVRQYKIKVIRAQKHYYSQTGIKDIKREKHKLDCNNNNNNNDRLTTFDPGQPG